MASLQIDRIACDGRGLCAELLPELIGLDDWGYPIVRPGDIPAALMNTAGLAVEACPVLALRVRTARDRDGAVNRLTAPPRTIADRT
jgi:ferredoxin